MRFFQERALARALDALRHVLGLAPHAQRREVIAGLSAALRREMIRYMETRSGNLRSSEKVRASRLGQTSREPGQTHGCGSLRSAWLALDFGGLDKVALTGSDVAPKADKRVWTVRTLTAVYHRARCQVDGVVVRSCSVRKPFEARAMNAQLRAARADLPPGTSAEERVRAMTHALTKVGATEVGGARRAPRTPTFAVVIDARRWIGKSLTSPTTTSIEEALAWRQLASDAEAGGWPTIRALWLHWMQAERLPRWGNRMRSAAEAEARAAAADVLLARLTEKGKLRGDRTGERSKRALGEHQSVRLERRLKLSVARAERSLARTIRAGRVVKKKQTKVECKSGSNAQQ